MWTNTENELWVALSGVVMELSSEPPLIKRHPYTLDTDLLGEKLTEITILWDAWQKLIVRQDSVLKHVGKLIIIEGLMRRPESWNQSEWEAYLNIYWRLSQLSITYNHLTQD